MGGCYVFVQSCNLKCLTVSFWLYCYIYSNITKKKQSNISDYKIEQKHNKQYNQKETVKHFRLQD